MSYTVQYDQAKNYGFIVYSPTGTPLRWFFVRDTALAYANTLNRLEGHPVTT